MKYVRPYIIGYFLSLVLTLAAFLWTAVHIEMGHAIPPHSVMLVVLALLAVAQMAVQLIFFLHLGDEQRPRFNLMSLSFAFFVIAILVGGTLWIMQNMSHGQAEAPKEYFTGGVVSPVTQND